MVCYIFFLSSYWKANYKMQGQRLIRNLEGGLEIESMEVEGCLWQLWLFVLGGLFIPTTSQFFFSFSLIFFSLSVIDLCF